jgi:hypothetical protein
MHKLTRRQLLVGAGVAGLGLGTGFRRDHGLQATARSGGHSYQGFSTSRGLVIDLAAMKSVALSADHGTVRIGAGARPITAPT